MVACHNTANKGDNRVANLRWDTQSENIKDQARQGVNPKTNKKRCSRGHLLAEPNLRKGRQKKSGWRECLSCHMGRTDAKRYQIDLLHAADQHYLRVMLSAQLAA